MNLKEVIKTLEIAKAEVEWNYPMDYAVAIDEAIKALDKQIPRKPKEYEDKYYACPSCGNPIMMKWEHYNDVPMDKSNGLPYCLGCGQAIDFDMSEETFAEYQKVLDKLAHYEDLEEAGRLIELPCAVGSLVWEIGLFQTDEGLGLFRAKPFALSDMEWDRLGNIVFLTLDEAIQRWKEIDIFKGFEDEIANVEAALKGAENATR